MAAPDGRPRYVLSVSPVERTVTVGTREELAVDVLEGQATRWCVPEPSEPVLRCSVQLRAHAAAVPGTVELRDGGGVRVVLDTTVNGIAAGQAAVFYRGTQVLGSATVTSAVRGLARA